VPDPCPHCHSVTPPPHWERFPIWLESPGMWHCVKCGWVKELIPSTKEVDKSIFRKTSGGLPKVWRTFQCIVCGYWNIGEFTQTRIICENVKCQRERNRRYAAWVTSGRPLQEGKKWYEK
jgi:hypothetical protein